MNDFLQTLRNLGPARLAAIAIVAFALLGFFVFITTRIASSPMGLLYSDLDPQDSGAIARKLDSMKIPYQVDSSGRSIKVPADQIGKIRMTMAADGLPKGGSVGYEIFDQKEGFGATSFIQNLNHLRALEGELARTVSSVQGVESARVHLVLPQRELFSNTTRTATASVFLKTRGASIGNGEIAAIQHLIAAAVPQLQPGQVSIVDDKGNLLARPRDSAEGITFSEKDDVRVTFEQAQARKIEDLLFQSLGYGKARAQVSVELDVDRVVTNSETFDPDSQVVRSTQTSSETSTTADNNQGVTITNNLPGTQDQRVGNNPINNSSRNEETINYEINKVVRSQIRESGQIRRLSVAVVVDGESTVDGEGKTIWRDRTPEEMEKIKALVRSAIPFDGKRGDTIEVANMKFAQVEQLINDNDRKTLLGLPREQFFRVSETIMLALVGLLAILLVVRPMLNRIMDSPDKSVDSELITTNISEKSLLSAPDSGQISINNAESQAGEDSMIDIKRVEGRVKSSSVRKIGEIIEKHPEEVVAIIRSWISQDSSQSSR